MSIHVRSDNDLYSFNSESSVDTGITGFGGRLFVFLFISGPLKGQIWASRNTWYQGEWSDMKKYKNNEMMEYYYERYLEHQDGPNAVILRCYRDYVAAADKFDSELSPNEAADCLALQKGQVARIR